jgi:L-iditol 2-dehydrogenase
MAALRKTRPGSDAAGVEDVAVPQAGPGQVRVAVRATGICGTDLHILRDEFPSTPPVTMGHEVSGIVDQAGDGVDPSLVGRRVALETYFSTCGHCAQCRSGRINLCVERRSIGSHVDGGFASYVVVPAVNAHEVHASVSVAAGSLYEPLACVAHCLCDPAVASPGDTALVVGPGAMGLLAAQVLRAQGAVVTVVGTDRDKVRLETARSLGLTAVLANDLVDAVVPPLGFDVVTDCSGAAAGIARGLELTRRGGHYVQIGLCGQPIPLAIDLVCLHEVILTSGFASTPVSWARAERLVAAGLVRLDPIVTRVGTLAEWRECFDLTRRAAGVKVVIDPGAAT